MPKDIFPSKLDTSNIYSLFACVPQEKQKKVVSLEMFSVKNDWLAATASSAAQTALSAYAFAERMHHLRLLYLQAAA